MSDDQQAPNNLIDLARALGERRTLTEVEVYTKHGRSRTFAVELRPDGGDVVQTGQRVSERYESGWAMRYGGKRGWGFTTGSGEPPVDPPLVQPRAGRLLLPQTPGPRRRHLEQTSLVSETAALRGLTRLVGGLPRVAINRRLELQDGVATSHLANNHGLDVDWPHRTGLLSLEEWLPGGAVLRLHAVAEDAAAALEMATQDWPDIVAQAQKIRWVPPRAAAAADESAATSAGPSEFGDDARSALPFDSPSQAEGPSTGPATPGGERASLVLSAAAASTLVGAALTSWGGEDRGDTVASPVVRLCDAPDWRGGPMSTAVDGQGQPLARRAVVHDGTLVATLADAETATVRRGWRDLPLPGYQQPVLLPGAAAVDELITGVSEGWWLPARIDVPAAATGPRLAVFLARRIGIGSIQRQMPPRLLILHVRPGDFCRSIRELADEISFHPARAGVIGLPAVRAEGLRVEEVG